TAGYVHQDSDLLWLDQDLIASRSQRCGVLIQAFERDHDPEIAVDLAESYTGKFALDFAYDDWSSDYREWLHVGWVHVMEIQIRSDVDSAQFQRGIDRKSTRLNSSHDQRSYAVFCLKKKRTRSVEPPPPPPRPCSHARARLTS